MLTAIQCKRTAELLSAQSAPEGSFGEIVGLIDALNTQAVLLDGYEAVPRSVVTLKTPANGIQTFWAAEQPAQVRARVHDARSHPSTSTANMDAGMVRLTAVRGFRGFDLWTRHDNVSSIEDYR